tara:strand:+ start:745 stop:1086 length:342 start_codon:yes stop_codon:yes gene_type:complete
MDYYKLLGGLKKDCSLEEIENAYKQLAPKYLMIKGGLMILSNAYEILSDPKLRERYDRDGIIHVNFTDPRLIYDAIFYPQKNIVTRFFCNRYPLHNDFLIHDEIENSHILGRG